MCLGNLWLLERSPKHKGDGVPRKIYGPVRWSRHRKIGAPWKPCGSGKMVRLGNLWLSKVLSTGGSVTRSRHRKDGA